MGAAPATRSTRSAPFLRIDRSLLRALAAFSDDRLRWLDGAAALGQVARLGFGFATVWVVTDPEVARTMLVTEGEAWTRPTAMRFPIRLGVGENLFTQSDRAWARVAPQVAPAFRRRALEERIAALDEVIATEVAALPLDVDIDLARAMGRIALMAAAWVLLGERLDRSRADALADHQQHIVNWVGARLGKVTAAVPFALGTGARHMREHRRALGNYADELIARQRTDGDPGNDVLGTLISARPGGRPLRAGALRAHVLGLFFAGNETTAAALSWALVHGARNPDEWERVRADPERVSAFIDETLRITPPAWGFTRTPTRRGVTLPSGEHTVRIRRGEVVTVYLRAAHRDPEIWPDPERFDPDRHLHAGREQHRALLPFGLGPRGCIGQHLALAELNAVIPALARRGDVRIDGAVVEDASFALRVAGGLRGRIVPVAPPG